MYIVKQREVTANISKINLGIRTMIFCRKLVFKIFFCKENIFDEMNVSKFLIFINFILLKFSNKLLRKLEDRKAIFFPSIYNFFLIIIKIINEKNKNIKNIIIDIFQLIKNILVAKNKIKKPSFIRFKIEKKTPLNLFDSSVIA
tara:strand:- start:183 stop:614 length:432 start_codon:yes stop_codon:yes gene_type:complete